MADYLSPGVYVEEKPGTPPIVGVGTSTAGFIGVVDNTAAFTMPDKPEGGKYELAAVNEPRLVTNWAQFINQFGDFQTGNSKLAHAVYGFFQNGGTRCWVSRVDGFSVSEADKIDTAKALKKFESIDEIAIVAAPGATDKASQDALIAHCKTLQDRFAILDGQQTTEITAEKIKGSTNDSNYAALYFPWIKTKDPLTGGTAIVPPSGHVAGVYARTDAERGVHKAPANTEVRGALGLEYPVSRNEQNGLNPNGINVIREFNGNIKIWGARTLGGDGNGEFKYINVRRVFNFLRESLDQGTQFAVFEPNARPLWQKLRRSATSFLTRVWRDGALFGDTPEQAFYVKCDETTNTPEVIAVGQVITEIGVALVRPAEFVIFRISQIATG